MKQNFGVPLSRNEMKNVMGGSNGFVANCSFTCTCKDRIIHAHCDDASSCSGVDEVGGKCGDVNHTCKDLCNGIN